MWTSYLLAFLFVTTSSYLPKTHDNYFNIKAFPLTGSRLFSFSSSSAASSDNDRSSPFDSDFADAMSKPLPRWYTDAKSDRDKVLAEIERNREQVVKDFRDKYEVSEATKRAESERKWQMIQQRTEEKAKQKKSWLSKAQLLLPKIGDKKEMDGTEEVVEPSPKENWENFLAEEEEQTGVAFPNIFDVFPELQFRWPKWAKRKDGSVIECETDRDCPVPLACCAHPIVPGPKFCCSGWGQRVLVKSYIPLEIKASSNNKEKEKENSERERRRREDGLLGGAGRDGTDRYFGMSP